MKLGEAEMVAMRTMLQVNRVHWTGAAIKQLLMYNRNVVFTPHELTESDFDKALARLEAMGLVKESRVIKVRKQRIKEYRVNFLKLFDEWLIGKDVPKQDYIELLEAAGMV